MGDGMCMDQRIHCRRHPVSESAMGHEDVHVSGSGGATVLTCATCMNDLFTCVTCGFCFHAISDKRFVTETIYTRLYTYSFRIRDRDYPCSYSYSYLIVSLFDSNSNVK